jgi:hypothetical protein
MWSPVLRPRWHQTNPCSCLQVAWISELSHQSRPPVTEPGHATSPSQMLHFSILGSGSDQKGPDPTGSGSATLLSITFSCWDRPGNLYTFAVWDFLLESVPTVILCLAPISVAGKEYLCRGGQCFGSASILYRSGVRSSLFSECGSSFEDESGSGSRVNRYKVFFPTTELTLTFILKK